MVPETPPVFIENIGTPEDVKTTIRYFETLCEYYRAIRRDREIEYRKFTDVLAEFSSFLAEFKKSAVKFRYNFPEMTTNDVRTHNLCVGLVKLRDEMDAALTRHLRLRRVKLKDANRYNPESAVKIIAMLSGVLTAELRAKLRVRFKHPAFNDFMSTQETLRLLLWRFEYDFSGRTQEEGLLFLEDIMEQHSRLMKSPLMLALSHSVNT